MTHFPRDERVLGNIVEKAIEAARSDWIDKEISAPEFQARQPLMHAAQRPAAMSVQEQALQKLLQRIVKAGTDRSRLQAVERSLLKSLQQNMLQVQSFAKSLPSTAGSYQRGRQQVILRLAQMLGKPNYQ